MYNVSDKCGLESLSNNCFNKSSLGNVPYFHINNGNSCCPNNDNIIDYETSINLAFTDTQNDFEHDLFRRGNSQHNEHYEHFARKKPIYVYKKKCKSHNDVQFNSLFNIITILLCLIIVLFIAIIIVKNDDYIKNLYSYI